jgi:hypothetical protein
VSVILPGYIEAMRSSKLSFGSTLPILCGLNDISLDVIFQLCPLILLRGVVVIMCCGIVYKMPPKFVLHINETASIEVTTTIKEDTLKPTFYHLYVNRLNWKTYLQGGLNYRVRIPTTYKTNIALYNVAPSSLDLNGTEVAAYTGANFAANGATIPSSGDVNNHHISLSRSNSSAHSVDNPFQAPRDGPPAVANPNPNDTDARGDKGGDFGGPSPKTSLPLSKGTYLGTFRGSGDLNKIHMNFILEWQDGASWVPINEDSGTPSSIYTFSYLSSNYKVEIYRNTDVSTHVNLPRLYYRGTTPVIANGTVITIGYHSYPVVNDAAGVNFIPPGTLAGAGPGAPEFILHLPKDETDDVPSAGTLVVDDFDSIAIPVHKRDLFELVLQKDIPSSVSYSGGSTGTTAGTGTAAVGNSHVTQSDDYITSSMRNVVLTYYTGMVWPNVWIRNVKWENAPGGVSDIRDQLINGASFTMHSGETIFEVTKTPGTDYLKFTVTTGLGTAKRTELHDIELVPFLPGVAPPPVSSLVALNQAP